MDNLRRRLERIKGPNASKQSPRPMYHDMYQLEKGGNSTLRSMTRSSAIWPLLYLLLHLPYLASKWPFFILDIQQPRPSRISTANIHFSSRRQVRSSLNWALLLDMSRTTGTMIYVGARYLLTSVEPLIHSSHQTSSPSSAIGSSRRTSG